jgi:hypothetical protein
MARPNSCIVSGGAQLRRSGRVTALLLKEPNTIGLARLPLVRLVGRAIEEVRRWQPRRSTRSGLRAGSSPG